jgi:hypothetical protein
MSHRRHLAGPFITHMEVIDTADVMLYNKRCKLRLAALAAKGFTHVIWPNLKTPYGALIDSAALPPSPHSTRLWCCPYST